MCYPITSLNFFFLLLLFSPSLPPHNTKLGVCESATIAKYFRPPRFYSFVTLTRHVLNKIIQ